MSNTNHNSKHKPKDNQPKGTFGTYLGGGGGAGTHDPAFVSLSAGGETDMTIR